MRLRSTECSSNYASFFKLGTVPSAAWRWSGFSRISQPEFIYNNAVTPNLLFAIFVARFNVRVEHLIFSI